MISLPAILVILERQERRQVLEVRASHDLLADPKDLLGRRDPRVLRYLDHPSVLPILARPAGQEGRHYQCDRCHQVVP